jgi:hypothetical protein
MQWSRGQEVVMRLTATSLASEKAGYLRIEERTIDGLPTLKSGKCLSNFGRGFVVD